MLYEIVWLVYALAVAIFLSIGLLGLILSTSIPALKLRTMAIILSGLIILSGFYFAYRWSTEKEGIRAFTQQSEQAIKQYLATHKK